MNFAAKPSRDPLLPNSRSVSTIIKGHWPAALGRLTVSRRAPLHLFRGVEPEVGVARALVG